MRADRLLSLRGLSTSETEALLLPRELIYLDPPRWFRAREPVPHLRTLSDALRQGRRLEFTYRDKTREADPLGVVNKAGTWYFVGCRDRGPVVFRVDRITAAHVLGTPVARPTGFDLPRFWAAWSAEFEASIPSIEVRVRASSSALKAFGEVFGDGWKQTAPSADRGFQEVLLTFEHEKAAAHRLSGFGGEIEVLSPSSVRDEIIAIARAILDRYPPREKR